MDRAGDWRCGQRAEQSRVEIDDCLETASGAQTLLCDDLTVRNQDLDLGFVLRIIKPLQQRDALHVLRLFERVSDVIGPSDAEAQVYAFAHHLPHLLIDRQAGARRNRQITRARQFDDAAADQQPVLRRDGQRRLDPQQFCIERSTNG